MLQSIVKITVENQNISSIDIPTMESLSSQDYREFIRNEGLFFVDHHDLLKSSVAHHPLATSNEQLEILISELNLLKGKLK